MTPAIESATKRGATFEQRGPEWIAIAHKRGRRVALVTFTAPTQDEAARMFCNYFHIKEAPNHALCATA